MGQRILAIEFAGDRVRAALADRTFKTLDLVGVYEQERAADEADLTGALARLVADTGRPDIVITALPGEFVAKRLLKLPFADRRRLQQVVPFALEEHLPFAVDESAVAFARVGKEAEDTLVLAAIARKAELQRHLELLERAAIDPKIVTLSTFALAGYLARTRNGRGGSHLVVEVDNANVSMVLIDANGAPRALRTVGRGRSGDINGHPEHDAVLGALRQVLLAHSAEGSTPEVVLAAGADQAGLQERLAKGLAAPVRQLTEVDSGALIHGINGHGGGFAGCFAMLAGEAPVAPLELLNFRQGQFAFHGATGAARPLRLTAMLVGAAVIVAALHLFFSMTVNARQLRLLNQQIEAAAGPVLGDSDPATARATLKSRIADLSKRLKLLGGNLGAGSPLDLLRDLSQAIPSSIPLQTDNLQIDDTGLKLDGSADSFATVDQIKRALERSGDFGSIEVEHAGAGADSSKVEFRLSATAKDGAD